MGIASLDPLIVRRQRLVNIFAYASAFNVGGQILVLAPQEFFGLLLPIAILALIGAALLSVPLFHRFGTNMGAHLLIALSVVGIVYSTWAFGLDSQVLVYFCMTGILFFVFGVENWRHYAPWFVIVVTSLQRDFLPSNWGDYSPTWVDVLTFAVDAMTAFMRLSGCARCVPSSTSAMLT